MDDSSDPPPSITAMLSLPKDHLGASAAESIESNIRANLIPVVHDAVPGVEIRVKTGEAFDARLPVRTKAEVQYLDIRLTAGSKVEAAEGGLHDAHSRPERLAIHPRRGGWKGCNDLF